MLYGHPLPYSAEVDAMSWTLGGRIERAKVLKCIDAMMCVKVDEEKYNGLVMVKVDGEQ